MIPREDTIRLSSGVVVCCTRCVCIIMYTYRYVMSVESPSPSGFMRDNVCTLA